MTSLINTSLTNDVHLRIVYCYYAESTTLLPLCNFVIGLVFIFFFLYAFVFLDTVEENILDLAAKHGRSLYTKDHAVGTVKVTPFEMDKKVSGDSQIKTNKKQKGQKGGFILR